MAALAQSLGALDVVVSSSGVLGRGQEYEPEVLANSLDVDLTGTMCDCSATRTGLAARLGCIVNTASMPSFFGSGVVPGCSAG